MGFETMKYWKVPDAVGIEHVRALDKSKVCTYMITSDPSCGCLLCVT